MVDIEGESDAVEKFITWSHHGPRFAKVDTVQITTAPLIGFTIFDAE